MVKSWCSFIAENNVIGVEPWLRKIVIALSPRRHGLNLRPVLMGFNGEKRDTVACFSPYSSVFLPVTVISAIVPYSFIQLSRTLYKVYN